MHAIGGRVRVEIFLCARLLLCLLQFVLDLFSELHRTTLLHVLLKRLMRLLKRVANREIGHGMTRVLVLSLTRLI